MKQLLGKNLHWVKLGELEEHGELSCIDGRHNHCIIGAPGGNMGEFILLLSAIEQQLNIQLENSLIDSLLNEFLNSFGKFYMHTDTHAVQNLLQESTQIKALSKWTSHFNNAEAFFDALQTLDEKKAKHILPLLLSANNIGCGHIQLLIKNSKLYRTRTALVEMTLKNFFLQLWKGNKKIHYAMLEGEHNEKCVINIDSQHEINENTLVPYICNKNKESKFVNHSVARHFFLQQGSTLLTKIARQHNINIDQQTLFEEAIKLSVFQLNSTLDKLATDLPTFRWVV